MQNNNPKILSTRPLGQQAQALATANGFSLQEVNLIETTAIDSQLLRQIIAAMTNNATTVIFTSMNAVTAVTNLLDHKIPAWKIYCLGNTTKQESEHYFGETAIQGTARNATELASLIITHRPEQAVFFCGNQRRDELPQLLRTAGVELQEVVVYNTTLIPQQLTEQYAGILFFSPSAVISYFSNNTPAPNTILFAIGATTEMALKEFTNNRIITAHMPDKRSLFELAIEYIKNIPQQLSTEANGDQ